MPPSSPRGAGRTAPPGYRVRHGGLTAPKLQAGRPRIIDLLRLLAFAGFLALGLRLAALRRWEARRRAVLALVGYLLAVHGLVLLQAMVRLADLDGWPFTSYTIAAPRANVHAPLCLVELRGVDRRGDEWPIDPLAWTPLHASVIHIWLNRHAGGLTGREREAVLGFLLAKAEAARARQRAGEPIGFERRLGPVLSAPYWWLLPRVRRVPAEPFAGLRVYRTCRVPLEAVRDPARVTRTLLMEHRG